MTTDILDEHRFRTQCSLYESNSGRQSKLHSTFSINASRNLRYGSCTSESSSFQPRHSLSSEILSLLRSFALKPFKISSFNSSVTDDLINLTPEPKPNVSLLNYRPLSVCVTDHAAYTQSIRVCMRPKKTYV